MRVLTKESIYGNHFRLIYEDGTYYEGQNKNDNRHGYGKLYYSDSSLKQAGNWIDNECIEEISVEKVNQILDEYLIKF